MPRNDPKTVQTARPAVPANPVLVESDLASWAGERIARSGRREALLGRVERLRLSPDGRCLEARVRGNRPLPYRVQIRAVDAALTSECTCARETRPACKHAVAAVEALRFPLSTPRKDGSTRPRGRRARGAEVGTIGPRTPGVAGFLVLDGPERTLGRDERIEAAQAEERGVRIGRARRARGEVTLLQPDGAPPTFHVGSRDGSSVERVTLRGAKARLGCCTCADFAENELRTCAHVERVLRWYLRKKKSIPGDLVSLWWRPRPWVDRSPDLLQELRIDLPGDRVPAALSPHFDDEGWLRPRPAGVAGVDWATEAARAARNAADAAGFRYDEDPLVDERLAAHLAHRELSRSLVDLAASDGEPWAEVRSGLRVRLHPYQEIGALFLARNGRAFLADDMGLGKTFQAVAAALLLRRAGRARRVLVVCPASLKHQWRREIDKVCGEAARVVEGPGARRLVQYDRWSEGFLIVNYELVLRDLDVIRSSADLVILDEAQRIKNWDTKTAHAVKQLRSPHAFILTGTPLENRLLELHSLVEFLHPRALGPRWRVLPFHAVTDAQGRVMAYEGLHALRKRLRPFFLRRDRATVLDQLPERTDNTFWTGMTLAQRHPYRKHAATVAALLSKGGPLPPGDVRRMLQALTSMRILCNARAQYAWEDVAARLADPAPPSRNELRALGSPKLEEFSRVLEDLLDEGEAKVVVFSQWERMLRLAHFAVRGLLEQRDLRADVFHGGLSSRARGTLLDEFRLDPELRLLFSTDAGGLGLNLQESASVVINLEVPWNPAVLEQRIGRVHRMGQRRSVQVLHFVTRGAIEERVRQVVESKRALFDGLLVHGTDRVVFNEEARSTFADRVLRLLGDDEATQP